MPREVLLESTPLNTEIQAPPPILPLGTIYFNSPEQNGPSTAEVTDKLLVLRNKYRNNIPFEDQPVLQDELTPDVAIMMVIAGQRPILPYVESQKIHFSSSGSINFQPELDRINELRSLLGLERGKRLAHDSSLDRARFERAKTGAEREAVRIGVIADMEKNLYERAFATVSTVYYYQGPDGRLYGYNPDYPDSDKEPIDVVFQRGLEFSKNQGFVDYNREAEEFEGWKEAMVVLFDPETPVNEKEIVISEKSKKKGSQFTDNFVDIFTKTIDPQTNQVMVVMGRFASEVDHQGYVNFAKSKDKNYFKKGKIEKGEEDIYFKRHPIHIEAAKDSRDTHQFFAEEFKTQKRALEENKVREYIAQCRLEVVHYANTVCAEFFNVENVKEAFNATLNVFDSLRKGLKIMFAAASEAVNSGISYAKNFLDRIHYYGRMMVEAIMVGCGLSAGFSLGKTFSGISSLLSAASESISSLIFGSDKYGTRALRCESCNATSQRPAGKLLTHYPCCGKEIPRCS